MFKFEILKSNASGRLGKIYTPHGIVDTPAIIFCATKAAIKGLTMDDMKSLGTQALISNTYNLMDHPGGDFIEYSGGLHKMMNWNAPLWTDSGGFQIFSLGCGSVSNEIKGKRQSTGFKVTITENGATFQSPRDGMMRELTPETSMQIQKQLGSNFMFLFDECTSYTLDKDSVQSSMERSNRWADRCINEYNAICNPEQQQMYGIVQGGVYDDLRLQSINFINSRPVFGYGIGGSLGTLQNDMENILNICHQNLLPHRPKHLLGIGKMQNIEMAIKYGIDTFDCVHPTRIARHGGALVSRKNWQKLPDGSYKEHISITNAKFRHDYTSIDDTCTCYTCKHYTKSYIHYLFAAKEILGLILLLKHNIHFMNTFMSNIRHQLKN